MNLILYAISDVGLLRANNEDIAILDDSLVRNGAASRRFSLDDAHPRLFGVADGVGGANAGEVASRKAAVGVLKRLRALGQDLDPKELPRILWSIAEAVHSDIMQQGSLSRRNFGMATTLSALVIYQRELVMLHAGDSRVYRFIDGSLEQLSRDHTLRALTKDETIPRNIIANCFGISADFFADVTRLGKVEGDEALYLICSDGLSDLLDHGEMEQILRADQPLPRLAARLVEDAKSAGGRDNISLVLARVDANAG